MMRLSCSGYLGLMLNTSSSVDARLRRTSAVDKKRKDMNKAILAAQCTSKAAHSMCRWQHTSMGSASEGLTRASH